MRFMTKNARGDSLARSNSRARKEKLTMWLNPAEFYCRVCDKQFNKLRALCGHMRVHARSWRGLLPPPDHHPRPRPPTYEASTSTGRRGELGINFQREPQLKVSLASPNLLDMLTPEPQVKGFLASPKFDLNMLPATEPQEEVPVSLKLEMQAAPEPKEKFDLNVSLSSIPDPPEADHDSHKKFNFDLNEAPEEDEANDY
uniref:C2H2-type domain-containing protein n=1 Tax=Quercus lobata TaxID=97700 RepID=A0A7N2MTI2_QUELO